MGVYRIVHISAVRRGWGLVRVLGNHYCKEAVSIDDCVLFSFDDVVVVVILGRGSVLLRLFCGRSSRGGVFVRVGSRWFGCFSRVFGLGWLFILNVAGFRAVFCCLVLIMRWLGCRCTRIGSVCSLRRLLFGRDVGRGCVK